MYYATWKPATDIFRSGQRWLVRMELAGVSRSEVELLVQQQRLTVRGRRRDLRLHGSFVCHSLEISYSNFERSFSFPGPIDADSISTEFRDGLLHILLSTL